MEIVKVETPKTLIWFAPEHIVAYGEGVDGGTWVSMSNGETFIVEMAPAQFNELMRDKLEANR